MEEKVYTKEEVVEFTINILSGISIPAALAESVGIPILRSIGNLTALKKTFEQERLEAEKGKDDGETDSE